MFWTITLAIFTGIVAAAWFLKSPQRFLSAAAAGAIIWIAGPVILLGAVGALHWLFHLDWLYVFRQFLIAIGVGVSAFLALYALGRTAQTVGPRLAVFLVGLTYPKWYADRRAAKERRRLGY